MLFKTELHCHVMDNGCSKCAHISSENLIQKYVDAGYTTIVLTNHVNGGTKYFGDRDYENGAKNYVNTYYELKKKAEGKLTVLFGIEVNFTSIPNNDFLVFGVEPEFMLKYPDMREYKLKNFHNLVNENGGILVQAHPFRPNMTIINNNYVDGIEVFNGHPGHPSHNDIAEKWANYYNLIKTSGTDTHDDHHPATCGILTEDPILDNKKLIETLKTNTQYRLIRFEKANATRPHPVD